jgi:hypothetical protein
MRSLEEIKHLNAKAAAAGQPKQHGLYDLVEVVRKRKRVDQIIAFENGEMDADEMVEFFQGMINDGTAWQLQGSYGRAASELINAGLCIRPAQDYRTPH